MEIVVCDETGALVSNIPVRPFWRYLIARVPAWLWLLLIAAPLRFVNLGQEPLWYDELFQIRWAQMPLADLMNIVRGDVHPPLWYLIEWVNVRLLGTSEFAVRVPAALLGVLTVWLVWRIALALGLARASAFVAGLLTAVMPAGLYYSQDARMYPLLTCAVLLAALAAIRGSWPVFALAAIVAIYSQNLAWFYIATIGVTAACMRPRQWIDGWRGPVLAAGTIGLAYLPWLPTAITQVQQVNGGYWIQPLTFPGFVFPYAKMIMGWRMPEPLQAHLYIVALLLTVIALITYRKHLLCRQSAILLSLSFGSPLLIGIISLLWHSIYLDRALLPATTAIMIFWAYALCNLSRANQRIALLVLIPCLAIGVVAHYFPVLPRNDTTLFRDIAANWNDGDILYFLQTDGLAGAGYYLPGKPYAVMPEEVSIRQSLSNKTRQAMKLNDATIEQVADQGYKRAWLIWSPGYMVSQSELDYADHILYSNHFVWQPAGQYGADPVNKAYVDLVYLK